MQTTNIKACLEAAGANREPTDAEIAGALEEGVEIMASLASSLERIAHAQTYLASAAGRQFFDNDWKPLD